MSNSYFQPEIEIHYYATSEFTLADVSCVDSAEADSHFCPVIFTQRRQ